MRKGEGDFLALLHTTDEVVVDTHPFETGQIGFTQRRVEDVFSCSSALCCQKDLERFGEILHRPAHGVDTLHGVALVLLHFL